MFSRKVSDLRVLDVALVIAAVIIVLSALTAERAGAADEGALEYSSPVHLTVGESEPECPIDSASLMDLPLEELMKIRISDVGAEKRQNVVASSEAPAVAKPKPVGIMARVKACFARLKLSKGNPRTKVSDYKSKPKWWQGWKAGEPDPRPDAFQRVRGYSPR